MKGRKILCLALVCALIAGVAALGYLNYAGLLSFVHPLKKAREGQIRVACVGDSVTYGFGIKNRAEYHYPKVLSALLGADYCVNNYGYSGRTVSGEGDRPYRNETLYERSLDFQPDIVVLMLGSNDSKPFNWDASLFEKHYNEILDSYENLDSHPEIYVVLPTPVFEVNGRVKYDIDKDVLREQILPLTRKIAEERGLKIIDMNAVFQDREALFSDGCHPDRAGARLFAETVYSSLRLTK